jgi:hypothetical protein
MSAEEAKIYGIIDEVIVRSLPKSPKDEAKSEAKGKDKD